MSVGEAPLPAGMFGRVRPDPEHWDAIVGTVPPAPLFAPVAAEPPRKSPPLWRYRLPRYRGQLIGCCVGESGAAMGETACRTPPGLGPDPDPTHARPADGTPAFSALAVYWMAREYSRRRGRPVAGEGAVVTDALSAVTEWGYVPYDAWPSTPANYNAYSDARPPAGFAQAARVKPVGEARRITSEAMVLQYLAAGYSLWFGGPWRGGTRTARDGAFSWRNPNMGGHAVELLGYDLDADRIYVGNSWDNAGWGVQPTEGSGLPRGWGYCPWSQFRQDLMVEDFESGSVEVCVICEVLPDPAPTPPTPTPTPTPTPAAWTPPTVVSVQGPGGVWTATPSWTFVPIPAPRP